MKILNMILAFMFCFSGTTILVNNNEYAKFDGIVEHIFIHSLIAYPEILCQKSQSTISLYHKDCIDYIEFENMLNQLYKNNYILIDIHKAYKIDRNGNAIKTKIYVPKGKKPFVMSIDDVVYDPKKMGNGMVDKLIVKNGKIASQTTFENGSIEIALDREFAPILENFVALHPDFSLNNAKMTINLTGFCGILGYRVLDKDLSIANTEIKNVREVIKVLKKLGYNFACHSFGHLHLKKINEQQLVDDLKNWKSCIEPLIGKTDIFAYPYGEWEIATQNDLSAKQKLLNNFGFKLFLGVGMKNFFGYMPYTNIKNKILLWDRKNIDGYSLLFHKNYLANLFDCDKIFSSWSKQR